MLENMLYIVMEILGLVSPKEVCIYLIIFLKNVEKLERPEAHINLKKIMKSTMESKHLLLKSLKFFK